MHTVVDPIATPSGLTFDVVERLGMHHGARRPGRPGRIRRGSNDLQRGIGIGTEAAGGFGTRYWVARIVAGDDPRACDGILAEFHEEGEHCGRSRVNLELAL